MPVVPLLGPVLTMMLGLLGASEVCASDQDIALWASDREAGAVIALDGRGREITRLSGLPRPAQLCPTSLAVEGRRWGTGVWAVVDEPVAGRGAVLVLPVGRGRLETAVWIGAFREISDLSVTRDGQILWIADSASEEVAVGFPPNLQTLTLPVPRALSLAPASDGGMWVGTAAGEIWRVPGHGVAERVARPGGVLTDLAAGEAGCLWALDAAGAGRVLLLGRDARVLWEGPGLAGAEHLAPAGGSVGVWMASTIEPFLALQGSRGGPTQTWSPVPGGPHDRVAVDGRGGAWLAAGDRLLRVDPGGGMTQTSSGYRRLTGLARAWEGPQ